MPGLSHVITIDGPAGAGKSTAAKRLARLLGFEVLDTGAMYRAVGLAALRGGISLSDQDALEHLLVSLRLELLPGQVLLNGEDVSASIRTAAVSSASSEVAVIPAVRRRLVDLQRAAAVGRRLVCEGRDQGTVVFPNAACKFFLEAAPLERARRRQREMEARGETVELASLLQAIEERDSRDAARDLAPMVPAADAVVLDSTALSLDEVVDRMAAEVLRRGAAC